MKIKKKFYSMVLVAIAFLTQLPVSAAERCNWNPAWMASMCEHVARPFQEGNWDIYLTGYAWHAGPLFRGRDLNAKAFGGGIGKHWIDENGHEDLVYAFAFADSYKHVQPIAGYARQWFTNPVGSVALGGGFTVGLTARADILRYIPVPVVLPIGAIRFNRFSVLGTVIPRKRGALGLIWGRYQF